LSDESAARNAADEHRILWLGADDGLQHHQDDSVVIHSYE
jgi:hypothetical protein